jgi:hypothetical protein
LGKQEFPAKEQECRAAGFAYGAYAPPGIVRLTGSTFQRQFSGTWNDYFYKVLIS